MSNATTYGDYPRKARETPNQRLEREARGVMERADQIEALLLGEPMTPEMRRIKKRFEERHDVDVDGYREKFGSE